MLKDKENILKVCLLTPDNLWVKLINPWSTSIDGISPAIAVEQKINSSNPRSTVGTKTEVI